MRTSLDNFSSLEDDDFVGEIGAAAERAGQIGLLIQGDEAEGNLHRGASGAGAE